LTLPLETGWLKISAYRAPVIAIALDALIPHNNLKTTKAGYVGDKASARVKIMNRADGTMTNSLLP